MRSLLASSLGKLSAALGWRGARGHTPGQSVPTARPDLLRRETLLTNSRILLAAGLIGMPFAIYDLIIGGLLPFILAMIALSAGVLTLALHERGNLDGAVSGQVYGMLLLGLVLTVADPAFADFGLAVALLAPVHASLLAPAAMKTRAWALLSAVVAFAAVATFGLLPWTMLYPTSYALVSALSFVVVAIVVSFTANRLNTTFDVYDRAQINAYRHLIEHVQDAVIRFSAEGEVLFTSRSSETLFGCRRYELSGGGLGERIHVLDRPLYLTAFADANMGGKARTIEVRMRRDDPNAAIKLPMFVWVEVALSPVLEGDHPEQRYEVVGLFRDITERKQHEVEMREARKTAEDANSAKSRFLATIGHELRTPLNAIVGFSEMMTTGIGGSLTPQHKEYAELIHGSGMHLLDVVRMLLDMSRLEAGKFELQTESFAPEGLVGPCVSIIEPLAREKQVTLKTDLRIGLPDVIADERACRQILINLLSNAVKFSNDGGQVVLSMWRQGQSLGISVKDNGIGMSTESLGRIGEPFFQVHDGLARRYEGTGLGLSIVKGLIDLHGGQLRAMSEPGYGTTITVLLPLNGPETRVGDTGVVTPLRREPQNQQQTTIWPEQKRKAL
ncbi:MAG: sensor histidine kinase [Devosia sp.]|nr:sensor histidine kinase [Devosia sp.]